MTITFPQIYWLFTLSLVGVSVALGWVLRGDEVARWRNEANKNAAAFFEVADIAERTIKAMNVYFHQVTNLKTEVSRLNHQLAKFHQARSANGRFARKL